MWVEKLSINIFFLKRELFIIRHDFVLSLNNLSNNPDRNDSELIDNYSDQWVI